MTTAFRADHVGSLLRPPELLEARTLHQQGQLDRGALTRVEDESILRALDLQRQAGMDIFSDGEYRRTEFRSDFADAVGGMVEIPSAAPSAAVLGGVDPIMAIGDKVQRLRRLTGHESSFLNQRAGGLAKITLPSVSQIVSSYYRPDVSARAYPRVSDLYPDIVSIVRQEIESLVDEGVAYIQIDAPRYTYFLDDRWRQRFREQGDDTDAMTDEWIEADNASFMELDLKGSTVAMHLCRGNNRGSWFGEGSYAPIAENLFNNIAVNRFLLEFDSERAGGFEPLRYMPKSKTVVLGLITTKAGSMENVDSLLHRIDEAAKHFPMENLAVSPQCGFATFFEGNPLSWDEQRRKLELVAETARRAWG